MKLFAPIFLMIPIQIICMSESDKELALTI